MYEEAGGMWLPSWSSSMMKDSLFPVQEEEQHTLLPFPAFDDLLLPELNLSNPALGLCDTNFAISEYDDLVGDVGELLKVPDPIIEDSLLTSVIPLMPDDYGITGMDSTHHEDLMLIAEFVDCKTSSNLHLHQLRPVSVPQGQDPDFVIPPALKAAAEEEDEESLQKSAGFGCLTSASGGGSLAGEVNYKMDLEAASGTNLMMVRTYSEGDIQAFVVPDMNLEGAASAMRTYSDRDVQGIGVNTSFGHGDRANTVTCFELLSVLEDVRLEERSRKLSRYRKKRTQRNFGRKIKYACRKALADSQPRIRGRFAKMKAPMMTSE